MAVSLELLKKLRKESGAGIADCRKALEVAGGDLDRARKILAKRGLEKAAEKEGKATSQGVVSSYVHATKKIGVLVELKCETDFVARTDEFQNLAHELALQVAAMNPKDAQALLKGEYIRDPSVSVETFVKSVVVKVGENITVGEFVRLELGQTREVIDG
jgi:elongation factor Ts